MKINSVEIKDSIAQYVNECRSIVDTCKKELRELTEDEQNRLDELKQAIADKKAELVKLQEELDKIEIPDENVDERAEDDVKEDDDKKEDEDDNENKEKNNDNVRNMKKEKFSLLGAIRSIVNQQNMNEINQAVLNAGAEEFRKSGIPFSGQIQLPSEERAAITVTAEGEDVVATDLFNIMEPLRANNVLVQAGAKFLPNLVGDVQVPIMTGANVAWAGETAAAADGAGAFTNIKLQPKRLTAYIDLSKQFIAQDGLGAEALIRKDLINAINTKLEATILGEGAGDGNTPAGIFNGKDAAQIKDFKALCDLEAGVEAANVVGECKYILSPKAKAALRNMPQSAKATRLVMEGGEVDGTPAMITTNVPADKLVYGNFDNLAVGAWSGIDLTVDPYTQAGNGMVRLVINAYFDAKVLRDEAFAFGTTAIA